MALLVVGLLAGFWLSFGAALWLLGRFWPELSYDTALTTMLGAGVVGGLIVALALRHWRRRRTR
ncbi:hypothetical protein [Azohydromonas caseinilytica]|uniref:Uncharacterized protein n=1 Tax=Azohydromonas caseinilytica TaxID=2728836 RepID=A0A848F9K3_9BURK|nr:hypothetical protein [Azohydromonas caseinilytica]NML14691.1 hypothetical protein [Azohydromonas caseinilytica]